VFKESFDLETQKQKQTISRSSTMKIALLDSENDASNFIEDYIHEIERVSKFFDNKLNQTLQELEDLKFQYEYKRKNIHDTSLNRSVLMFQTKI
jgi:hypothetical protein